MPNTPAINHLEAAKAALELAALELTQGALDHRKASRSLSARVESNAAGSVDHMVEIINELLKALNQKLPDPADGQLTPLHDDVIQALVAQGAKEGKAKIAVCRAIVSLPASATFDELWRKALELLK